MSRTIVFILLLLFAVVAENRSEIIEGDEFVEADFELTTMSGLEEDFGDQRVEALEKLQQIFGIRDRSDRPDHHKIPPQFMMELYNTIADSSGVTRGKNPYNARVVRSFIERDSSMPLYYLFNISSLEVDESVLEAELHLYRKRTPLEAIHPTILSSPYYLIRVYQVLDEKHLDIPDLHRLLNVHYVGAHASGWQVFNVKQAVLSWVSGAPNLGLLVTASTLFGDEVSVDFSRRKDNHHSKQPILVLFDDDGKDRKTHGDNSAPHYYKYNNALEDDQDLTYKGPEIDLDDKYNNEHFERRKRHKRDLVDLPEVEEVEEEEDEEEEEEDEGEEEEEEEENEDQEHPRIRRETNKDQIAKNLEDQNDLGDIQDLISDDFYRYPTRQRRNSTPTENKHGFVSKKMRIDQAMTSMDIYERAMIRERLSNRKQPLRADPQRTNKTQNRRKRSTKKQTHAFVQPNTTDCARHDLYVDFEEIGWSSFIVAPAGYSAYHCKGQCSFPLSQSQRPTNHATVQSVVNVLGLAKGVDEPCCVPAKLMSFSVLYFDNSDNVILKRYDDMVVDRCGCH